MKYRSKKRRRPLVPVLAVLAALGIAFAVPDSGEKPVESQKVQQAEDGEQAGSRRKSAGRASGGSTGESSPAGKAENAAPVPVGDQEAETAVSFNLSQVPAYAGNPAYVVNGNVPFFSEADLTTAPFENYSPLDALGRCGTAYANVCRDIMPTEPRGEIGSVRPSGWHTVKYSGLVDGNYLYNRCHLIAYSLAGENANDRNLITGTRYMNTQGMLPYEEDTRSYVRRTGHHVLYRVTPVFEKDNLLASGVLMEAQSVEDDNFHFCVYCYNVQPGVTIDYATGDSVPDGT